MTVWKPLTCDCVLEYDGNRNFIKALSKCSTHVNLEGKTLLMKVVEDNVKLSKKAKPSKGLFARLFGR